MRRAGSSASAMTPSSICPLSAAPSPSCHPNSKTRISHRAKVLRQALPTLRTLLVNPLPTVPDKCSNTV
jgi:hypothetical protein